MTIEEFETKVKEEIDAEISIRVNPNAPDIAGVYWREAYIGVAVPSVEIREEFDPKYQDNVGVPYRNVEQAMNMIKGKLPTYQDPENYKLMTEKA